MTTPPNPAHRRVERIYPLSPLQEGMVYHALLDRENDAYVESVSFALDGALDVPAFRAAWAAVVARHAALRTSIHRTDQAQARQVVHRAVELPWTEYDWRDLADAEQETELAALWRRSRDEGFDLTRPPLFRLILVRLADERHRVIWTNHHAVLDGWSRATVFREVMTRYAEGAGPELPPVRQYGDYIAWLQQQDLARAQSFWRADLAG